MVILGNNLLNTNVEKIRLEIPSLKDIVFFNSGWTGPTPKPVYDAILKSFENQINLGPSSKEAVILQVAELEKTRYMIASFFSTKSENICLTTGTTLGINLALNAYSWNPDDEIITTKTDHASVILPLYNLKDRYKVKIKIIDLDFSNPLKSFKEAINKNTKAAVFCHIFWANGNVLELKDIVTELRNKGVVSIIDGAQSAGALKVDLDNLSPDFYAVPGQKWLLGPAGTGFLYVNKNMFDKRPPWPSILGYESTGNAGDDGQYDLNFKWHPKKNAGLFEFGGMNNSLFSGLSAAIDFARKNMGNIDIYKRIFLLASYLSGKLKENLEIELVTDKNHAGLVAWKHKKTPAKEIVSKLWNEKKILIREIPNFNLCRASLHYFNTKEEIDLLISSL